jgi:hypothetical protein
VLDNKKLSEKLKSSLRGLAYEQQVEIWNRHCSTCPFSRVKLHTQYKDLDCVNIQEAREVIVGAGSDISILRSCTYDDGDYTLYEIVTNTCRFWDTSKIEIDTAETE